MRYNLLNLFLFFSLGISVSEFAFAQAKEPLAPVSKLRPFVSDGCSLPETLSDAKYKSCCLAHDIAYWVGGTLEDKKEADIALVNCIKSKGAFEWTAGVWQTVLTNFGENQWGADWIPRRKNTPLSNAEWEQVKAYKNLFSEGIPIIKSYSTKKECSAMVIKLLKEVTTISADASNFCYNLDSSKSDVVTQVIYSSKCRNGFLVFQRYFDRGRIKIDNLAGYGDCTDEIRSERRTMQPPTIYYRHEPVPYLKTSQ